MQWWVLEEGSFCFECIFSHFLHPTLPSALLKPLSSKSIEFYFSRRIPCVWNVNLSRNHLNLTLRFPVGWIFSQKGDLSYGVSPWYLAWWLHAGQRAHPSSNGRSAHHTAIEYLGESETAEESLMDVRMAEEEKEWQEERMRWQRRRRGMSASSLTRLPSCLPYLLLIQTTGLRSWLGQCAALGCHRLRRQMSLRVNTDSVCMDVVRPGIALSQEDDLGAFFQP